jgi:CDP-6-deoxy-D-xylo-4-hexulose-3-dehydrase
MAKARPTLSVSRTDRTEAIRSEIHGLIEEYFILAHQQSAFLPGKSSVPVSGRVYDAADISSLIDSALEFSLTIGRFNDEFQANLAKRIGIAFALTMNSGSSANLVALAALTSHMLRERRLEAGDEVITAATGFPTTVNPTLLLGMTPVFIDVDIPTYNVVPELVEAAIGDRTRAIMVAHTLGNPFDVASVAEIAKRHSLFLIEDCCDALGATLGGRHVGTFGDIGTLSFYPAHHITMGEGGAAFTSSPVLRRAMESIRDWGRDCYCAPAKEDTCGRRFGWQLGELPFGYDHKYSYSHLGFNLKITDMQAAVGLSQLRHLDGFVAARRRNFARLFQGLHSLESYFVLPQATPNTEPSWFGFPITVREDAPFGRDAVVHYLNEKKVHTRPLFAGNLVRQPYMLGRNFRICGELRNSDRVMQQTFWIGVYPGLSDAQIDYVCEQFHAFCAGRG